MLGGVLWTLFSLATVVVSLDETRLGIPSYLAAVLYWLVAVVPLLRPAAGCAAPADMPGLSAVANKTRAYSGEASLRPTMPTTIRKIEATRSRSAGSLRNRMPMAAVPTAPMPVHTA
jgi:hypothetical protein